MKKSKSGCNGYYLTTDGKHCEIHGKKVITVRDCKKCTCPSNKYKWAGHQGKGEKRTNWERAFDIKEGKIRPPQKQKGEKMKIIKGTSIRIKGIDLCSSGWVPKQITKVVHINTQFSQPEYGAMVHLQKDATKPPAKKRELVYFYRNDFTVVRKFKAL